MCTLHDLQVGCVSRVGIVPLHVTQVLYQTARNGRDDLDDLSVEHDLSVEYIISVDDLSEDYLYV